MTPSSQPRVCGKCSKPVYCFDGAISSSLEPGVTNHTDCAKAARMDYPDIARRFQNVLYTETRRWWGRGIMETDDLPEELRIKFDAWMIPLINRLDEALKEAWRA